MSNKSPRQSRSKKPGKTVKEKRMIKKARRAVAENDRMAVFLRGEPGSPKTNTATAVDQSPGSVVEVGDVAPPSLAILRRFLGRYAATPRNLSTSDDKL